MAAVAFSAAPAAWAQSAPAAPAVPVPAEVAAELPGARLQGSGRLRFLGLAIYTSRLWVADRAVGASDWAAVPLALEIEYARTLYGSLIAERSLKEMRRQGAPSDAQAEQWLAQLNRLLPDVKEGDRITGVQRPGQASLFFLNGTLRGEVRDADFTRVFFGIWLAPQTSEPALRTQLLGAGVKP